MKPSNFKQTNTKPSNTNHKSYNRNALSAPGVQMLDQLKPHYTILRGQHGYVNIIQAVYGKSDTDSITYPDHMVRIESHEGLILVCVLAITLVFEELDDYIIFNLIPRMCDIFRGPNAYHIRTNFQHYLCGVSAKELSMVDLLTKAGGLKLRQTNKIQTCLQYHGLAAFSSISSPSGNLTSILEYKHIICGADAPIGPVGILFRGVAYAAFTNDVGSSKATRSKVSLTQCVAESEWMLASKLTFAEDVLGGHEYMESWSSVECVLGIWVAPSAFTYQVEAARYMANELGVPLLYGMPERIGNFNSAEEALSRFKTQAYESEPFIGQEYEDLY